MKAIPGAVAPSQGRPGACGAYCGGAPVPPELLTRHLDFCAQAAAQVPVYQMTYPHRRDVFAEVLALLQQIAL